MATRVSCIPGLWERNKNKMKEKLTSRGIRISKNRHILSVVNLHKNKPYLWWEKHSAQHAPPKIIVFKVNMKWNTACWYSTYSLPSSHDACYSILCLPCMHNASYSISCLPYLHNDRYSVLCNLAHTMLAIPFYCFLAYAMFFYSTDQEVPNHTLYLLNYLLPIPGTSDAFVKGNTTQLTGFDCNH